MCFLVGAKMITDKSTDKGGNTSYGNGDQLHSLLIIADDYGYSTERDRGIIKCFQGSAISAASFLVNGVHAMEASEWAKKDHLPLGLHLNLTEGRPVGDIETCASLANQDGLFLGKFGFRQHVKEGKICLSELKQEIENQIERFEELLGYLPHHVDGHQHVHVIPGVAEVFAEVLNNKGIKVTRLPRERCIDDCDWLEADKMNFYKEVISQTTASQQIFHKYGLWFTASFSGLSTCGVDMTVPRLQRALEIAFSQCTDMTSVKEAMFHNVTTGTGHSTTARPIRTCELMVHPGYSTRNSGGCGAGPDDFSQSKDRENEMSILLGEAFKSYLKDHQISLCNFINIFKK